MTRFSLLAAAFAAVTLAPAADPPPLPEPPKPGTIALAGATGIRLDARLEESRDNLKKIGIACLEFHIAQEKFPAGVFDKSGKKLGLSWQVAILPYLKEEDLYRRFRLTEPWDSEHNRKLIGRIPKVFVAPEGQTTGYTYYRMFTGKKALVPPDLSGEPGKPALGRCVSDVGDGCLNTFMAVEAADPVIWTKPDELEYDPAKPVPKVGGIFEHGFHAVSCAGVVQFVKKGADEKAVRTYITPADGEPPGELP